MKKLVIAFIASIQMSGCAILWSKHEVVQRIKFPEAEYVSLKQTGNSQISGQVFAKTRGGDVKLGAGNEVLLNPVTSYSTQWYKESYLLSNEMSEGDERQQKYIRKTISDGNGKFTFKNIPAGEYYVVSHVVWEVPTGSLIYSQGGLIAQKIKVNDNDSVEVMLVR